MTPCHVQESLIRLPEVRHAAATMLDGGTPPSATARWLGHFRSQYGRMATCTTTHRQCPEGSRASSGQAKHPVGATHRTHPPVRDVRKMRGSVCPDSEALTRCRESVGTLLAQRRFPDCQNPRFALGRDQYVREWARRVSNPRPLVCKTRALPLSYTPVLGQVTRRRGRHGKSVSRRQRRQRCRPHRLVARLAGLLHSANRIDAAAVDRRTCRGWRTRRRR